MDETVDSLIEALEDTWRSTAALCAGIDDEAWQRPTGCPGWTVKDNVSHIVGLELELLGEPLPEHTLPDLEHVGNDIARHMEIAVDVRRPATGAHVLAELSEVTARRLEQLRSGPRDPDVEVEGLMGFRSKLRSMLGIRVFDCWAHEQDIRRALGQPGGHDGPAGQVSWRRMQSGLRRVLPTRVPALAGSAVEVDVAGRPPLLLGEGGVRATVHVDADSFTALVCGRSDAGEAKIEGDHELAADVLAAMAITP